MKIGELYVQLDAKISGFTKKLSDAERSLQNIGKKFAAVGKQLTMRLSLPLIALGGVAVKAFSDFDRSMTESTAIMGKLSDSVKKDMADLAKTISTQTTFSAKELAAAYFYLASAGMDAQQSMKALGEVARFAQAGAFDLSTATDLLTDAQTALGLSSKDAARNQENLVRVGDVLVKANTLANASVQQFAEALTSKAAAALVNVNKEVEEGVAVLAAYADKGIKGTLAGERLTMMLNGLFAATQQNKKAWDDVGISLFDAKGAMRGIGDIIGDMEVLLGSMTTEQKQATLAQLGFNVRTKDSILTLIGSSEKIKQWTKDLRDAGGTMREVSDKQMESFSNKMKILKNRLVNVGIELGEKLAPVIEKIAVKIEKAAKWFSNLSDGTKELILIIAGLAAALGPVLMIFGNLLIVIPKVGLALKALAGPFGIVTAGLILIIAKAIEAKKEFEKMSKLYQKEADITGKKVGWLKKTLGSVDAAWSKLALGIDTNKIALQGYSATMRAAKPIYTAVTGVTKGLTEAKGFLIDKFKSLNDMIPTTRKEFALLHSGFKNLTTEAYENLSPALKEMYDNLDKKVNPAIKVTYELAETAAQNIGSLTSSMEGFAFATVDVQKVLDNLKPVMTNVWEEAIPPARNFSHVLDQVPTKLEDIAVASEETGETVKSIWEDVSQRMKDLWADNLGDMLLGAKSFKDALGAVWDGIKKMFADLIAKMVVDWAFNGVKNLISGATKAASGIGSAFKSVGKAVSGIGTGIGKLIVTLAKAIAKAAGIIAKAAPEILIAAGVALAIYAGFKLIGALFAKKGGVAADQMAKIAQNTSNINDVLRIDMRDGQFNRMLDHLGESQKHLFAIQARADRRNQLLTKMEGYLLKIRDFTEPLSKIKFAASGISETVKSPTLYMAGERGAEHVNISPLGTLNVAPQINIQPIVVKQDEGWLIKFIQKEAKQERLFIHPNAVRAT